MSGTVLVALHLLVLQSPNSLPRVSFVIRRVPCQNCGNKAFPLFHGLSLSAYHEIFARWKQIFTGAWALSCSQHRAQVPLADPTPWPQAQAAPEAKEGRRRRRRGSQEPLQRSGRQDSKPPVNASLSHMTSLQNINPK